MALNKGRSSIEWLRNPIDNSLGFTINPVKGLCPADCKDNQGKSYCYARRLYRRFHLHKDGTPNPTWDYTIRFEPLDYKKYPAGSRVFVGSTIDLFGEWVKESWLDQILEWCRRLPEVTFIFLTKRPENLIKWSPFPENCWVGVSAVDHEMAFNASCNLIPIEAKVKFISFEPLLGHVGPAVLDLLMKQIQWVIIGQQTPVKKAKMPKIEWVQDILVAAHNAGDVPVFLKGSLKPLIEREWANWKMLQEFPK